MQVHPRLSVSAICTFGWSLDEDLEFWTSAGIGHVGVSVAKLDRAGPGAVQKVVAANLRVGNLIGPGPFSLHDRAEWPEQRDRLRSLLEAAEEMGAATLVLTTGPPAGLSWEQAADALADACAPVLEEGFVTPLAFEHTNSLRPDIGFLQTLRDAIDLARGLGVGVCMECNACWLERGLAGTIASGVDLIRLVQVSDFVVGTKDTPDRAVPGDGDIPIARMLGQVLDAGYQGSFDLEIIGPRIEAEGYRSAIDRSVRAIGDVLESLGA